MTDIVERLRNVFPIGWEGEMRHKAADEIERLRACVLAARREGIEAAAQAAENCLHPSAERTAHAAVEDAVAAIRALLTEGGQ